LYKANESFEKCFNDDHPIIQKYYAASAEVGSTIEDQEMMISMARKLCDIVEHNN
jgi:hypothetical protein